MNNFDDDDRQQLYEIHSTVKSLAEDLKSLKKELEISKNEVKQVKAENVRLKQAVNMTNYKLDELEQYGRRENLRIHGIQESPNNKDDGKNIVLNIAKILNMELNENKIQRVHRLGKKKKSPTARPRPIIARFVSYKNRNEFLYAKKKLKENAIHKSAFITEDLTPLRAKLLRCVKEECEDNFVSCHTINGAIIMKKSAYKNGFPLDENGKDLGTGNWLYVKSPDDLFRYVENIDFSKPNYKPLL